MHSSLASPRTRSSCLALALVAALILLLSGWTCRAMFVSCQGVSQPQITSLSPASIQGDTDSVLLTVEGSSFAPQSQILWNGNVLPTTSIDSQHLQTTITQQTFESFGGSVGSSVQISVRSQGNLPDTSCPIDGVSAALTLVIT